MIEYTKKVKCSFLHAIEYCSTRHEGESDGGGRVLLAASSSVSNSRSSEGDGEW